MGAIPSPKFPFTCLRVAGTMVIILGLADLAIGTVDILYTELRYGNDCNQANYQAGWQCSVQPCGFSAIMYSRTAAGLWSAIFLIITGSIAVTFNRNYENSVKAKRTALLAFGALVTFPIGPGCLVIVILRLYYSRNVFYCTDASGDFVITDYVSFLLPLMTGVSVLLAWFMVLGVLFSLCRRGQLYEKNEATYAYQQGYLEPSASRWADYDTGPVRSPDRTYDRTLPLPDRPQVFPTARYWDPGTGFFNSHYRRNRFLDDRDAEVARPRPQPESRRSRWRQPWETVRRWTRTTSRSLPHERSTRQASHRRPRERRPREDYALDPYRQRTNGYRRTPAAPYPIRDYYTTRTHLRKY